MDNNDDIEELNNNGNENLNNNEDETINRNLDSSFRNTSSAASTNLPATQSPLRNRTPVPLTVGNNQLIPMIDSIFPEQFEIIRLDSEMTFGHLQLLLFHQDDQFHITTAEEVQKWRRTEGDAFQFLLEGFNMHELVVDAPDTADSLRNAVISRIMRCISTEIMLIAYVLLMAPHHREPVHTFKYPRRHNNDYDHTVPHARYNGHGWGEFLRITMHHHMDYLFIEDLGKWHWDRKVIKRDRTCPTLHMIAPLMNNVLVSRHLCELLRQSLRCIDFFRPEFIDSHPRLCLAFVGFLAEGVKKPPIGGIPDSFYWNMMNHVPRLWYRDAYPGALGYTHPEGTHRTMADRKQCISFMAEQITPFSVPRQQVGACPSQNQQVTPQGAGHGQGHGHGHGQGHGQGHGHGHGQGHGQGQGHGHGQEWIYGNKL